MYMINRFSISQAPAESSISLKTVWFVKADTSYDIYKSDKDKNETVLIRTVGGQGTINAEGLGTLYLNEGTVLLLKLKEIKRYYCSYKHWDFWWFEFLATETLDLFCHRLISSHYLKNEEDQVVSCMKALRKDDAVSQHYASSLFSCLLYSWLKNSGVCLHYLLPYEKDIREVASYMQSNLQKNILIKDMAGRIGVCEKYFRQLFKAVYQIPPRKYFNQMRMQAAKAMLKNTNLPVYIISNKLGYSSPFHFTREFKKHFQKTPSQFRKRMP